MYYTKLNNFLLSKLIIFKCTYSKYLGKVAKIKTHKICVGFFVHYHVIIINYIYVMLIINNISNNLSEFSTDAT